MLDKVPASDADAADLARLRQGLEDSQRSYGLLTNIQDVILSRLKPGGAGDVPELMKIQVAIQNNLRQLRQLMDQNIHNLTARSARAAEARDQTVLEVTSITTALAIAFGLVFAWLMARRMVQPVEVLMSGVRSVERGDLETRLPVQSSDEIGALTASFNKLVDDLRSQAQLKATFGKYVDPRIVESVILNPSLAEAEGSKRAMTISFCDLVGFTGIGEELSPTTLVRLLNRHFGLMAEAIHESQGVVDKLIGDAVMAFWGPPFAKAGEHAALACKAALEQLRVLERFRAELPDITGLRRHAPLIDLRIGLASGDVVVGNIGSENARSYTVIGDTVNLASRLEGVNRLYGTRILLNAETRRLAGAAIETREIDWIAVKGQVRARQRLRTAGRDGSNGAGNAGPARQLRGKSGGVPAVRFRCRMRRSAADAQSECRRWPFNTSARARPANAGAATGGRLGRRLASGGKVRFGRRGPGANYCPAFFRGGSFGEATPTFQPHTRSPLSLRLETTASLSSNIPGNR